MVYLLAEKYYPISPNAYVANNPMIFIDPDGREIDISELYRKKGGRYLHETQIKAFEAFANTEGGKAELAKYAKEGQIIAGIIFEGDGDYHIAGVDISFTGSTGITDQFRNGEAGAEVDQESSRLKISIRTNPNDDIGSGVETMTHEMIIHGRQYVRDFTNNNKLDNSHIYKELRDHADRIGRGTGYMHHWQELNVDRNLEREGIPIIMEYYQNSGRIVSEESIRKRTKFVP